MEKASTQSQTNPQTSPQAKLLESIRKKAPLINTLDELKAKLSLDRPLRVKYGIDPTAPHVHLGHTVPLRLLREFQDAGHIAQIVIGDFTASLGDPSGRDEMRTGVTLLEARKNGQKYIEQIMKIIDSNPRKNFVYWNSSWFENLDLRWVIEKLKDFTVQQITSRDDFRKRMISNVGVHLSETLYPILQGEDSVRLESDIELGGSEQLFTLMVGREMQFKAGKPPQVAITLPILRGIDGVKRMGKSLGNYIGVNEPPFEIYSKTMSIPDDLLEEWTTLLTNLKPPSDKDFNKPNPMDEKKRLAFDLVKQHHSEVEATRAAEEWHRRFSLRQAPEEMKEVMVQYIEVTLLNLVWACGVTDSKGDARRLINQGAVSCDTKKMKDPNESITPTPGLVVKVGRSYIRIK